MKFRRSDISLKYIYIYICNIRKKLTKQYEKWNKNISSRTGKSECLKLFPSNRYIKFSPLKSKKEKRKYGEHHCRTEGRVPRVHICRSCFRIPSFSFWNTTADKCVSGFRKKKKKASAGSSTKTFPSRSFSVSSLRDRKEISLPTERSLVCLWRKKKEKRISIYFSYTVSYIRVISSLNNKW